MYNCNTYLKIETPVKNPITNSTILIHCQIIQVKRIIKYSRIYYLILQIAINNINGIKKMLKTVQKTTVNFCLHFRIL